MVSEEKRWEEESFFTLREALLFRVFVVKKRYRRPQSRRELTESAEVSEVSRR
jgi:hypothetical protein